MGDASVPDSGMNVPTDMGIADIGMFDAGACPDPTKQVTILGGPSFCSLLDAVQNAPDGATLLASAGEFQEVVRLERALTLRGAGRGLTVLRGSAGVTTVSMIAAGASLEDLTIQAEGGVGVEISAMATVRNVEILSASLTGLGIQTGGVATVSSVRIAGVSGDPMVTSGVLVRPGAEAALESCSIEDVTGVGIQVDGSVARIAATQVLRSAMAGVLVGDNSAVTLEQSCSIRENMGTGVLVEQGRLVMRNSESSQNGSQGGNIEDGLWLSEAISATIEGNTFSGNNGYGMFCTDPFVPDSCSGNNFSGNAKGDTNCMGCN